MLLDRSIAPVKQPIGKLSFSSPELIFFGDIPVMALENKDNGIISIEIHFESGKGKEQTNGLSYLTTKMLNRGTEQLSASEISKSFEELGSFFELISGIDHVTLKLHSLKKNFQKSLQLVSSVIQKSTLPEEELRRNQKIYAERIHQEMQKSSFTANVHFLEALFGNSHPYGKGYDIQSILGLTRDQVLDFYTNKLFLNPKIVIVGDFSDQIGDIEKELIQLPFKKTDTILTHTLRKSKDIRVDKANNQASIRVGSICMDRKSPTIHDLEIADTLLGGYFGSRLMQNLREKKGLSYGVQSQIYHFMNDSYWVISSEVNKEQKEEALKAIEIEIQNLQEVSAETEELDNLKNYAKGKLIGCTDSPFSFSQLFKPLFLCDIPFQYLNDYMERLDDISPKEILEVAANNFKIDTRVIVS